MKDMHVHVKPYYYLINADFFQIPQEPLFFQLNDLAAAWTPAKQIAYRIVARISDDL